MVDAHPLWEVVRQVQELCQSDGWPDNPETRDAVSRAVWLCSHIESRTDANCITRSSLDAARDAMQALHSNLTGLRADPPAATPDNVHGNIDQALAAVAGWPHPDVARSARDAAEGFRRYQKMADDALAALSGEVERVQGQAAAWQEQWQEDATAQIGSAQEANTRLQEKVDEATAELATQRQRLDTALNEFTTKSQGAEKERDATETRAREAREKLAREQLDAQGRSGQERLTTMDGLLKQARETLQTIGKEASASHYGTYANQQRKAAFWWSILVLVALGAAAAFLLWAAAKHEMDSWHSATGRYALGVVFVGAATYAGRQSALHRRLERQSRQRELAIGALGSFLADVEPEDVHALKLGVAAELFIDDRETEPAQDGYQAPGAQIADAFRDVVQRRAKRPAQPPG